MVDSHMTGNILNSTHKERNSHSNRNTEDHTWPMKKEIMSKIKTGKGNNKDETGSWPSDDEFYLEKVMTPQHTRKENHIDPH